MGVTVKDFLESQIEEKLAEAATIPELAEKAARPPTDTETARVEELLRDVGEMKSQIRGLEKGEELKGLIDGLRAVGDGPAEEVKGASTIGGAFVKSSNYLALKEHGFSGSWKSGPIEIPTWRGGGQKVTVTEVASPVIQPDVQPGILPKLFWPLTIADLFATGATTSNTVRYIKELVNTNAAAGTAEGAAKPESAITFSQVDTTVGKITTFLPVSDEMLEDVAQIESYLDQRLGLFVQIKEDAELLNGSGSPSVTGILNVSGLQTGTAASLGNTYLLDAIFEAMTLVKTQSFLDADAIVMSPTDWASIRLEKDANNQYYGGGPFTGAYGAGGGMAPNNIWGVPVVVTTAIAAHTILVGSFRQGGQVFRRQGLTIEASNSHLDFFQKNLTAIRAEERLALVTYRPAAFYAITGADALEAGS